MRIPQTSASRPTSLLRARCRAAWTSRTTLLGAALLALAVYSMWDAWTDMASIAATDEEQSHAFIVPLVAGWLFWVRRERLHDYAPGNWWAGPALVGLGWAMNAIGDLRHVEAAWHLGAILVAVGAVVTVVGGGVILRFLPAFASLAFLVPVPGGLRQAIAIPLQSATAAATESVLQTLGVAVQRNGNLLTINGQDLLVAEACNGLRMVFALVLVSFAFAFGVPFRNWFRVCVVLLSPLSAILFNVVRLVPTVWAFGQVSPDAAMVIHDIGGWLMVPIAFLTLMAFLRALRWAQVPVTPYVLAYGY